jgi:5-methylcytosine-specific restriction endonuclease McrA
VKLRRCATLREDIDMLKTCTYCGRIHDRKYTCPQKAASLERRANRRRKYSDQDRLRNTNAWKKKSLHIRERDQYLCQACLNGIGYTKSRRIETENLQVHHIIPLKTDRNEALNNENLITLCETCHELAEQGKISSERLVEIAQRNEKTPPGV